MIFFRVLFFLLSFLVATTGMAQTRLEDKIKAAYLYNFTKFISWPEISGDRFTICLLGQDGVTELLATLEDRKAQGKPIHLQPIKSLKNLNTACQILYLAENSRFQLQKKLAGVLVVKSIDHTLTVSSQPSFIRQGGMIGFVIVDQRVRLQINLTTLRQSELKISAKLLEVADVVQEGEHE